MTSVSRLPDDVAAQTGTIDSPDGTRIGYVRMGAGPPLVVCHGSFATAQDWLPFATQFADTHTVYLYDRRGRGTSPHTLSPAALDAEVSDLATIMTLAGPEAAVLGHSFGGGCALSFASRAQAGGPVIVYEPRHSIDGPVSRGHTPEIRRLLRDSDNETVVRMILKNVIGLPQEDIAAFSQSPLWARMIETVEAFPGELDFLDHLTWRPGDLDGITGPIWLLVGEDSPILPADREGALGGVLKDLRRVTLTGQGHFAYLTAPAELAAAVRNCLLTTPANNNTSSARTFDTDRNTDD